VYKRQGLIENQFGFTILVSSCGLQELREVKSSDTRKQI
jgi:hypothetical protein